MEFRQLQHFLIAAQENSFSKAADKIYISQQALSKSIAALEQELKVPLFQRTHRGVSLTEQGRIFQKKAYAIMEMMNNTLIEMQNLQAVQNQSIPLSVTSGLENWLDIEYLLAFSNRYPEYTICTRADDDIQIEEKIHCPIPVIFTFMQCFASPLQSQMIAFLIFIIFGIGFCNINIFSRIGDLSPICQIT